MAWKCFTVKTFSLNRRGSSHVRFFWVKCWFFVHSNWPRWSTSNLSSNILDTLEEPRQGGEVQREGAPVFWWSFILIFPPRLRQKNAWGSQLYTGFAVAAQQCSWEGRLSTSKTAMDPYYIHICMHMIATRSNRKHSRQSNRSDTHPSSFYGKNCVVENPFGAVALSIQTQKQTLWHPRAPPATLELVLPTALGKVSGVKVLAYHKTDAIPWLSCSNGSSGSPGAAVPDTWSRCQPHSQVCERGQVVVESRFRFNLMFFDMR